MKKSIRSGLTGITCAIMLAGCVFSAGGRDGCADEVPPASIDFAYRPDDGAFYGYTFEFYNFNDKYLMTVSSPDEKTIELTLENGALETSSLMVYAPEGYVADIPATQRQAKAYFNAVNGMYHTGAIPQILRIDFYNPQSNTSENDVFSRYYAVKNGRPAEIPVYLNENGGTVLDRYPEMMTKMASQTAMMKLTEEAGEPQICCYEFDYANFRIDAYTCAEDDCNPLYRGYYKYYRAMKVYELLKFYDFDASSLSAPYNGYKLSRDEKYETFAQLSDAAASVFSDEYLDMSGAFDRFDRTSERLMVRSVPSGTNTEPADDVLLTVNENSENENELTYWAVAGVSDEDGRVYYSTGIFTIKYEDGIWKAVTFSYPERP